MTLKNYNCDLHFHSPYAAGCSKNLSIPLLSKEAKIKGLDILTTADILHPIWLKHVKENIIKDVNGCYIFKDDKDNNKKTYFILGTEVECKQRVHNLIYFKDFETVEKFKKKILKYSSDMESYGGGRPRLRLTCDQLLDVTLDFDVIIGPAHAFTPYYGIYAHYNSLKEAYGKNYKEIKFLELGLSADTSIANVIPNLKEIKFFSFSDSHSPFSFRIGREYVNITLEKPNYESLKDLLNNKGKNKINYNVGFDPQEGKYNNTGCRDCGQIHTLDQAEENKYRCLACKGIVKKGVSDKAKEIGIVQGNKDLKQIVKRPPYKYLIPLAQVIQVALNNKSISNKPVVNMYQKFIDSGYTEIDLMQTVDKSILESIDKNIAKYIIAFRNGYVVFKPGCAGHYGIPYICFSEKEKIKKLKEIKEEIKIKSIQKTLF